MKQLNLSLLKLALVFVVFGLATGSESQGQMQEQEQEQEYKIEGPYSVWVPQMQVPCVRGTQAAQTAFMQERLGEDLLWSGRLAIEHDASSAAYLYQARDGAWSFLIELPDGQRCGWASGEDGMPNPKWAPRELGTPT